MANVNNFTRSLSNNNIVSFAVNAKNMAIAMGTIRDEFEYHLYKLAEDGDNELCEDDWDGGEEEIVVKVTDTINDITYNVTYGFGTSCSGSAFVTSNYEGYDGYYGPQYDVDVELDEFYITTYNEDGDEGYDIIDVTIDGDKASMEFFNTLPKDKRIEYFKNKTVDLRRNKEYTEYNLSDYVFENAKELY